MATVTEYKHIELDKNGKPVIAGTRFKVHLLVAAKQVNNWDAEELQANYPDLTLSQIYSSLSYFYDHQEEIENMLETESKMAEEHRKAQGTTPFELRLKAIGKQWE